MTFLHDYEASQIRGCISAICEQIRLLEKQKGTEYEIAMLRARKDDLKEELMDWGWKFYFSQYRKYAIRVVSSGEY